MTASTTIRFNTEAERRNYQSGLAIIAAKLATTRHKLTAGEIHRRSMATGQLELAAARGADKAIKAFTADPQAFAPAKATRTPAPATRATTATRPAAPAPKAFRKFSRKTIHRYCMGGLF